MTGKMEMEILERYLEGYRIRRADKRYGKACAFAFPTPSTNAF